MGLEGLLLAWKPDAVEAYRPPTWFDLQVLGVVEGELKRREVPGLVEAAWSREQVRGLGQE